MKIKITIFCLLIPAILLFILPGCVRASSKKETQKLRVTVSLPPYVSLVQAIAGESVEVRSISQIDFNPHAMELSFRQVENIEHSALWVASGQPYEKHLLASLKQANPQLPVLEMHRHIPLLDLDEDVCCAFETKDLHFWLSLKRLPSQVEILTNYLALINPDHKKEYMQNKAKLLEQISFLDQKVSELLRPYQGQKIIVSHPFLKYFCSDYNLQQIAIESEGKSLSLAAAHSLLQTNGKGTIPCVITTPQFNDQAARYIAQKFNFKICEINPLNPPLATIWQIVQSLTSPQSDG